MIILPRQTRDKHKKRSKKESIFSQSGMWENTILWLSADNGPNKTIMMISSTL
jgi:hypothetical protein